MDDARRLLGIYLNDHLAGSTAGLELAKRSRRANHGSELGAFLERLVVQIDEDRAALGQVMRALGVKPSAVKKATGVAAERLGRLKLNGRITSYSPLSRVLELEGLTIGIEGKLSMWRNLRDGARIGDSVPGVDLDRLVERAERQLEELGPHRVEAARRAFA